MSKSSRVTELLAITSRLIDCLQQEMEAIRAMRPQSLKQLQVEKIALADTYRAFALALKEPSDETAAIGAALSNPSEALAIAGGLQSTIATLNLVASETAKGEAGARHLIENARGLTQGALASVLKYSEGLLDANGIDVAPALASLPGNTAPPGPAP